MSFMKKLRQLEQRFALSLLGFVVGIVGIGFTAATFFYDKKPSLIYEIVGNTSVVDVHENIDKLVVLYAGTDIQKNHEVLRVLVIKLVNDGNAPVLKSDYDDNDPLGFTLTNGRVIQSEIIDASNDYLHKQTKLNRPSPAMVTFSDVILEPKAFFTIKALVIASDQVQDLGIRPIGTVANVRATEVVPTYKEHENVPLLRRTFSGGIEVQLVRIGVYFFGSLALLIGLIVLLSTISDRRQKNKRKRLVNGFRDVSTAEIDKAGEAVLDLFVEHGAGALRVIETLIADPARLQNASKSGKRRVGGGHTYIETMVSTEGEQIIPGSVHFTTDTFFFEQLMEAGVLRKSGQTIEVDANAKRVFESFLHYHKKRTAEKRPNHRVSKQ